MRLAPLPVNMFFGPGLSFDPECLRTNPRKFQPTVTISRLLTLRTPTNFLEGTVMHIERVLDK